MHECVLTHDLESRADVSTLDIAKRLLDFGIHPPTIYFPLVVRGALMIEPTETESKETLDGFVAAMERIYDEALQAPDNLKRAPHRSGSAGSTRPRPPATRCSAGSRRPEGLRLRPHPRAVAIFSTAASSLM